MDMAALDLKAMREARGISLHDIFLATRITIHNLEAIEDGRFQVLPEPVYARTFIKMYAKFLGMDGQPTLDRYDRYLNSLTGPPLTREDQVEKPKPDTKPKVKRKAAIWGGVAVAMVVVLYLIFSPDANVFPPARHETPPSAIKPPPVPPQESLVPSGSSPAAPGSSALPAPPVKEENKPGIAPVNLTGREIGRSAAGEQPSKPEGSRAVPVVSPDQRYRITITATEKTWLRIRGDGKPAEEMTLVEGDVVERFSADSFALDIGNAGGISISFQGKPLGSPGRSGQVVHLKLP